jgi:DNA polymerase-3 subunit gamma/tau
VLGRVFQMRRITWTFVSQNAQVIGYDGRVLTLGIATEGLTNTFRAGNHAGIVRQALIDELGIEATVEGVHTPDAADAMPTHEAPPGPSFGAPDPDATGQSAPPQQGPPQTQPEQQAPSASPGPRPSPPSARATGEAVVNAGLSPTAPRRSLEDNAGWGSVTAPPPDWATASGPPTSPQQNGAPAGSDVPRVNEPSGQNRRNEPALRGTRSGADAVRASLDAARRSGPPQANSPAEPARPVTDDSAVSDDDEDIEVSTDVGRAVIEKVLGGRVLGEFDE